MDEHQQHDETSSRGADFEKRIDEFGDNIDEKLKKLPVPILSLGDGVCITVGLLVIYWILKGLDVITFEVLWPVWLFVGAGIFLISVIARYAVRSSRTTAAESPAKDT